MATLWILLRSIMASGNLFTNFHYYTRRGTKTHVLKVSELTNDYLSYLPYNSDSQLASRKQSTPEQTINAASTSDSVVAYDRLK